jgi:hypothetical protein
MWCSVVRLRKAAMHAEESRGHREREEASRERFVQCSKTWGRGQVGSTEKIFTNLFKQVRNFKKEDMFEYEHLHMPYIPYRPKFTLKCNPKANNTVKKNVLSRSPMAFIVYRLSTFFLPLEYITYIITES